MTCKSETKSTGAPSHLWDGALPDVIVIGPGGCKGFLELGALLYLEKNSLLRNVKIYSGVSVGAVIGLLITAGYSITDIISEALQTNLFQDISHINFSDMKLNSGLISNEHISHKLSQLVRNKYGFIPTLKQLYMATGIKLVSVTMNIDTHIPEYLSHETDPDLSCVEAVLLSMNIPFLFYKMKYKGNVYIDGAFGNPYPIDQYDDGKSNILGLYIETQYIGSSNLTYLFKVLTSSIHEIRRRIQKASSSRCRHLIFPSNIIDVTGITVDTATKSQMVLMGHQHAMKFMTSEEPDEVIIIDPVDSSGSHIEIIPGMFQIT